eukprot:1155585-Pelagomonas_calceolata.AAC.4
MRLIALLGSQMLLATHLQGRVYAHKHAYTHARACAHHQLAGNDAILSYSKADPTAINAMKTRAGADALKCHPESSAYIVAFFPREREIASKGWGMHNNL